MAASEPFLTAKLENPRIDIDLAGACLTQQVLNTVTELMGHNNQAVDIHLRRVSTSAVPKLTAEFETKGDNL